MLQRRKVSQTFWKPKVLWGSSHWVNCVPPSSEPMIWGTPACTSKLQTSGPLHTLSPFHARVSGWLSLGQQLFPNLELS